MSQWDIMYRMGNIINNNVTLLYGVKWQLGLLWGSFLNVYTNFKSLCRTSELMLCVNYTLIKKK